MFKRIIIDTESNGPEKWAEVWQVSWQTVDSNYQVLHSDSGYLQPISRMNSKAMSITGLDRKTILKSAEPAEQLYGRFLSDLRGCKAIIGHSVEFDICRIANDAERRCSTELANKVKEALKGIPYYDTAAHTLSIAGKKTYIRHWWHGRVCYEERLGYSSLVELGRKLGVDMAGLAIHSAGGDVELTRRCMVAMKEQFPKLLADLGNGKNAEKVYAL